jgi:hypothetical protein
MSEQTFDDWATEYMVCTEFAAAYKRANAQAVIKFGHVDGNEHCWVYDPEQDRTLDATLGQFLSLPFEDDWFAGDDHPHAEERAEYHDVETFARGPGGLNLLED